MLRESRRHCGASSSPTVQRMPAPSFFSKFGFFVVEDFFDRDLCSQLRADMRAGISSVALVGSGREFVVNREFRRVNQVEVNNVSTALVRTRLIDVKPDLERHFDVALTDCQGPQFLHYVTGDFYQCHRDRRSDENASDMSKDRRISVVIFLIGTSAEHRDSMYGDGGLTFYELLD